MAPIRRVGTLKAPLHFEQLKDNRILASAGFIRGRMRGRYRATEYWPDLYQMILARNPSLSTDLRRFGSDRHA